MEEQFKRPVMINIKRDMSQLDIFGCYKTMKRFCIFVTLYLWVRANHIPKLRNFELSITFMLKFVLLHEPKGNP